MEKLNQLHPKIEFVWGLLCLWFNISIFSIIKENIWWAWMIIKCNWDFDIWSSQLKIKICKINIIMKLMVYACQPYNIEIQVQYMRLQYFIIGVKGWCALCTFYFAKMHIIQRWVTLTYLFVILYNFMLHNMYIVFLKI